MGGPMGDWPPQMPLVVEVAKDSGGWIKWLAGVVAAVIAGIAVEIFRRSKK